MPAAARRKPKIGLVLGGGGAAGMAHIGVLKAMEAEGIHPDFIVGSSSGALIGALYASGVDVTLMERLGRLISWKDLSPLTIPRMMGLIPAENIKKLYLKYATCHSFKELKIPMAVVMTDLKAGERVVVQDGDLADAIQGSCSIPGIFTPTVQGDRLYVDGGILCNVPVDVARMMGADLVIASDAFAGWVEPDKISNAMHVVSHAMYLMVKKMGELAAQEADFLVKMNHPEANITNFAISQALIDDAERQTLALAADIHERIHAWMGHSRDTEPLPPRPEKSWRELFFGNLRLLPR